MSITLKQVADYQEAAQKQTAQMFEVAVASFFKAVPELEFVTFKVYAPSFNDGEPCLPQFQSEVAYSFVAAGFHEDYNGMSSIDDMPGTMLLSTWGTANAIEAYKAMDHDFFAEESQESEGVPSDVDLSPAKIQAIQEFQEGIIGLGDNFFYNQFDGGQYVFTREGVEVLEAYDEY